MKRVGMLFFLLVTFSVYGYQFHTAYLIANLPDDWKCELKQGIWTCQSSTHPVIVNFTAIKLENELASMSPTDALKIIDEQLDKQTVAAKKSGSVRVERVTLNNREWSSRSEIQNNTRNHSLNVVGRLYDLNLLISVQFLTPIKYEERVESMFRKITESLQLIENSLVSSH